ncbi:hypothetical protein M758_11G006600 [Ceratodon purpureus]|uniref:Regulatory particle non-ATPase 13 n=1 Tax=Ceratodon purpureus TaxID=3225 RepID=A0A8T0GBY8_CERPU|nr:hypothetical protein KC19_11G007800 [Ceratodon purpureus]KAG0600087.1 hypothetical protein M758_11G006600 [Ceratodon purpureus]
MGLTPASISPVPVPPDQDVLLEIRAGKMIASGTRVTPDPRKGLIRLVKAEDTLLHFQWWDRTTFALEDDQIVFPEEATFEKVGQSSGRVYLLKFKHDDRKFFFWMQEADKSMDADICNVVMHLLNHPLESDGEDELEDSPQPLSENSDVMASDLLEATATSRDLAGGSSSMLSGVPGGTNTGVVQLADLQRILSGLGQSSEANIAMARDTGPGFSELLRPDIVRPLLDNLHLEDRLAPYLPEGVRTKQAIAELMQSPQFHQQLDAFTQVIRSGQIDLSQFGIDSSRYNYTVASFLEAIEDQAASGSNDQEREQRRDQDVMEEGQ